MKGHKVQKLAAGAAKGEGRAEVASTKVSETKHK